MIFDLIVLAVLFISAGISFFRGFICETLTILGIVGGLVAAYFGGPLLAPIVLGWFDTGTAEEPKKLLDIIPYDMAADVIAYGSVFIIVVIVLSIASHLLSGWAKAIGLGAVDRTMGVIFGLIRGVIIIALLYIPISLVTDREDIENSQFVKDSKTHFYIAAIADGLMGIVPDSWKEKANDKAEETAESMSQAARDKLQELEVLQDGEEQHQQPPAPVLTPQVPPPGAAPAPQQPPAHELVPQGYQKDQRQDMNQLFEENSDGSE